MGTRALIHVKEEPYGGKAPKTLMTLHNSFDGYPEGLGNDIKNCCPTKMVNGISLGHMEGGVGGYANGMGCLAMQLVRGLKEQGSTIGGLYAYPPDTPVTDQEYVYTLYPSDDVQDRGIKEWWPILLDIADSEGRLLYRGRLADFDPSVPMLAADLQSA